MIGSVGTAGLAVVVTAVGGSWTAANSVMSSHLVMVRQDVADMKKAVDAMRADLETVKQDTGTIKADLETVKHSSGTMKADLESMKHDVRDIMQMLQKLQ